MEVILYIISAIISHFIVECFIQSKVTRSLKFEDKNTLNNYSIGYGIFMSVSSIVMMSGIGIAYEHPSLFFSSIFSGIVYYFLSYMISIKAVKLLLLKLPEIEVIYAQWFMNINFILIYLLILNLITKI